MNNTRDLSQFGNRERHIAAQLLLAYGSNKDHTRFLNDDITIEFNLNSGNVFLVDGDFNVAMMNGDILEDFIVCVECGHEDFASEFVECDSECCKEYANEIGMAG